MSHTVRVHGWELDGRHTLQKLDQSCSRLARTSHAPPPSIRVHLIDMDSILILGPGPTVETVATSQAFINRTVFPAMLASSRQSKGECLSWKRSAKCKLFGRASHPPSVRPITSALPACPCYGVCQRPGIQKCQRGSQSFKAALAHPSERKRWWVVEIL